MLSKSLLENCHAPRRRDVGVEERSASELGRRSSQASAVLPDSAAAAATGCLPPVLAGLRSGLHLYYSCSRFLFPAFAFTLSAPPPFTFFRAAHTLNRPSSESVRTSSSFGCAASSAPSGT